MAFKIESHNHPSAVEPYQGAATGVGGILRDVIAAGAGPARCSTSCALAIPARPIRGASCRGWCVASLTTATRWACRTSGTDFFDPGYEGNPLVNVLCAGPAAPRRHSPGAGRWRGACAAARRAPTGRDGVLGAAFASEALGDSGSHAGRRSHIQVGDPFAGKLGMEALLAFGPDQGLLGAGPRRLRPGLRDVRDGGGRRRRLRRGSDAVPTREPGLSPIEIFLSETQERFAVVVRSEAVPQALAHFFRSRCDSGSDRAQHRRWRGAGASSRGPSDRASGGAGCRGHRTVNGRWLKGRRRRLLRRGFWRSRRW